MLFKTKSICGVAATKTQIYYICKIDENIDRAALARNSVVGCSFGREHLKSFTTEAAINPTVPSRSLATRDIRRNEVN